MSRTAFLVFACLCAGARASEPMPVPARAPVQSTEDLLTNLVAGAMGYLQAVDKEDAYKRWASVKEAQIVQRMEDAKLGRDAVVHQMVLDFVTDNRKVLKEGPEKADTKTRIDLARGVRFLHAQQVGVDLREYEERVRAWGDWFLKEANDGGARCNSEVAVEGKAEKRNTGSGGDSGRAAGSP